MTLQGQKSFIAKMHLKKHLEKPTDSISADELKNEVAALGEVWVTLDEMEKLISSLKFLQSRQEE